MAEVTALRNNGLPYPVYAAPYGVVFPILDADGDLVTGATTPDSEVSLNGDTFADCTNEATEIDTTSGMYYLLLTAAEMTADVVSVIVKSATAGAKTTALVLYPRKLVSLATGTSQGGAAGYITLAASTVLFDNQYSGCLCVGTIDTNVESRILGACTASNQQCAVTPGWNVAPDADDTYIIYLPEGMRVPAANIRAVSDDTTAADNLESACDNYSATRGLAGTALPAAAADGAGGLPISDAGGLDMDTQVKTTIDSILTDTAEIGVAGAGLTSVGLAADAVSASALKTDAVTEIVNAILASVIEGTVTTAHALQLILAACAGKSDGGGTATLHFRDIGDTKNRITATVDTDGNRTAITPSYD